MGPHHQTYLLTCDVSELLNSFEAIGLRTNVELAQRLGNRLQERLRHALADEASVAVLQMADIRKSVQQILVGISHDHACVVTTNRLLCQNGLNDFSLPCLEINRLVDNKGGKLGIGARPWHRSPKEQIAEIATLHGHRDIIILEDGSFEGHTVAQLATDCRSHGLVVTDIVCGIFFLKGRRRIEESGYRGSIHYAYLAANCLDWMPDHDFFPFLPSSGKVQGTEHEGEYRPVRFNTSSVSFPYILPYGNPVQWASIPTKHAHPFSMGCLTDCIELFEDMGSINGTPITLEMIARLYPRASFPQRLQNPRPVPPPSTQILDILREDHAVLKEMKP